MYQAGMSASTIAATMGLKTDSELRRLRADGASVRPWAKEVNDAELLNRRRAGVSLRQIAKEFGLSKASVAYKLHRGG